MEDIAFVAGQAARLFTDPPTAALMALLLAAAVIDSRTLRIPNWLTLAGLLAGLLAGALGAPSAIDGLLRAAAGAGVALLVFLPLWLVRSLGAGDVKLMAAAGAFLGPLAVAQDAIVVFVTGGLFALAHAAAAGTLRRLASNLRLAAWSLLPSTMGLRAGLRAAGASSVGRLPYAWSICAGTFAFLLARQLGFF